MSNKINKELEKNNCNIDDSELKNVQTMIDIQDRKLQIENEDKKQDAQRYMAWFSLLGMLLYPFTVVLAEALGLYQSANIIGNMASIYFVSVAAIVAAFYGTQAYVAKNKE